ncbi:MAG: hypothetical protein LEGION0398_MBIBDBAK_01155 [Legionellaceae bacterium]
MQGHHHFQTQVEINLDLETLIPPHHLLRRIDKYVATVLKYN